MTTTIKSSFLIDDLLSAFKRPTASNITSVPIPSHPPVPTKESSLPIPANEIAPIALNFFQPPNQFNQYAAIKPELHPFFFHGMFEEKKLNSIIGRHSTWKKSTGGRHLLALACPLRRQSPCRRMIRMRWLMSMMNSYSNENSSFNRLSFFSLRTRKKERFVICFFYSFQWDMVWLVIYS